MKNARFFTANDINLSLSNLIDSGCTVMDITDVIEDAKTAESLVEGLNSLCLFERFRIDRKTDRYVRLKSSDPFGNVHYLTAYYDDPQNTNNGELAAKFCEAIKTISEKPDNLENLERYLNGHFSEWMKKYANDPESLVSEFVAFATMDI